jgi:hypothetical protein
MRDAKMIEELRKKVDTFEYERNELIKYIELNNMTKANRSRSRNNSIQLGEK